MFLNELNIHQVVLLLVPSCTDFKFNSSKYSDYFTGTTLLKHRYVERHLIDFSFKVSKNLNIFLFIKKDIEWWTSQKGFAQIYSYIVKELTNFITECKTDFHFDCRVTNIQGTFPVTENRFAVLKKCNRLQIALDKFFSSQEKEKPLFIPYEEKNYFELVFKSDDVIRIYNRKGTIVTKSINRFLQLENLLSEFVNFKYESQRLDSNQVCAQRTSLHKP